MQDYTEETDRVDGRLKVTGGAKYAAEYEVPGLTYAVLVGSTIAKGTIKSIDTKAAEKAPGVLGVITYVNMLAIPGYTPEGPTSPGGLKLFAGNSIYFSDQPIAVVVADTFERATYAASLVKAEYGKEAPQTDPDKAEERARPPKGGRSAEYKRGEAGAYKSAPVYIEAEYTLANEVHNPMELGSIIAVWEGSDKLTVYNKTQGVKSSQGTYARLFGLKRENVRVVAPFVGGGFGMALRNWPYEVAAIVAAQKVGRPVKLMLTRMQMFTNVGYRPHTVQQIGFGASADGKLVGLTHKATAITASYEDFTEGVTGMTQFMYDCPNVDTAYKLIPLDISVPTWMRGPGEATGSLALECGLDELAYKLGMDPLELRIRNYPEVNPQSKQPWSSNNIRDCYTMGAEKIGWYGRNRVPRSMQEAGMLVGYGVSCGVFGASKGGATVKARLMADGSLLLQTAVTDIGPGTGTAMTNIAAEVLGLPAGRIKTEIGDSDLPPAPTQGGSGVTSAVGSAVFDVCTALKEQLVELAVTTEGSALKGVDKTGLTVKDGTITGNSKKITYTDLLKAANLPQVEITQESKGGGPERQKYAFNSFSVHFTKVRVHPATGVVRVVQVVTCADAGTIVSPKTARSQMIGGVVGGIGMALTEEAVFDHRFGRLANGNFAD